ncbi:unnamed protein product [Protopolystoma xenopodis]|uniref:Uncharacterized protein n=1 Tax=Protopolystoma xenopodis TaxID=117903 RepID=A0A3S5BPA6_9PLAT|nr:unnamed protein product [Protopolystoma xenopodis]
MHPTRHLLISAHADGLLAFWPSVCTAPGLAGINSFESSGSMPSSFLHLASDTVLEPARIVRLDHYVASDSTLTDQAPLGRPTCLCYLHNCPEPTTSSHCLVGTSTGWLMLVDIETGVMVNKIAPARDDAVDLIVRRSLGTDNDTSTLALPPFWSQLGLHALASHHTLNMVVGAHQDRRVRFYDVARLSGSCSAGVCIESMVTHLDSVTSLAVDPHGLYLLTGSRSLKMILLRHLHSQS